MYDILEENVTLVENIEKPRQPYPSYEAIYILTPCIESCSRLVDDFSRKEGKMYAAAHVHFINALENNTFNEFTRLLNAANAANDIRSLKEMYVDFLVRENCVYTLDDQRKFLGLFGSYETSPSTIEMQLDDIARQLLCVCVTLGENPLIRYHRPLDIKDTINRRIPEQLAKLIQSELDNFCTTNPEFPPPRDPPLPSGTLIILDRTIDPISPFLHEFTYQAMLADLLPVEEISNGLKYEYKYTQEDGTTQNQEVTLIETDPVYTSIRHMHIANTTEKLISDFNAFLNENKISTSGSTTVATLNDMKTMISNLPQYQEMKSRFSAHMNIANECMQEFKDQNLEEIGLIEQDMACGETPEGDKPKNLVEALTPILDDPLTSQMIKARLILLWIVSSDSVDPEDLETLLAVARLEQEYKDAIENIKLLGVQLSKSANRLGKKMKKQERTTKKKQEDDVPFDLSRYVPVVKRIVEGHIDGTIDQSLFPNNIRNVKQNNTRKNTSEAHKEAPKLRVYKTQWHKKSTGANAAPKPPSGPPVIIFIVGGMTYSEIRSAYEIAETYDREIYIGSTHIITPDKFVKDLCQLDKRLSPSNSVVPAYTGSVHKKSTTSATQSSITSKNSNKKTALPPRTASSISNSNVSSKSGHHKLLGKW
ncbi:Sec1-like protein [Cokeromyces recurvatus]|uniref:Sec1-like protein n=1 Tax=Cokeromyces recurvatus TaxID=90255 RepID=UPI002220F773|nr:Sec1-like protein [Cokeromyces recurvatus]KAI7907869.1 Sec1-like protein [Cokeromyces recurvatus]